MILRGRRVLPASPKRCRLAEVFFGRRAGHGGGRRRRHRTPRSVATDLQPAGDAAHAPSRGRHRPHHRATSPAAARIVADGGFDAVEIHLGHGYLLERVPQPEAQQAHRPVGRHRSRTALASPRQVAHGGARRGRRPASRCIGQAQHGRRRARRVVARRERRGGASCSKPTAHSTRSSSPAAARCRTRCTCSAARRRSREMAAAMPGLDAARLPLVGKRFLPEYPFEEAYFLPYARQFRAALSMPLDPARRHQPARHRSQRAMAEGFEFVAMGRALLREPDLVDRLQRATRRGRCASTATSACRRSTAAPTASWSAGDRPGFSSAGRGPDGSCR